MDINTAKMILAAKAGRDDFGIEQISENQFTITMPENKKQAASLSDFMDAMKSRGLKNRKAPDWLVETRQSYCTACPAYKKGLGGNHYCNECGCPETPLSRLDGDGYTKLHYPRVSCPRKNPGFSNFFSTVNVINLARRGDRWKQFLSGMPDDWCFKVPDRFIAVDGHLAEDKPKWWGEHGYGTWGCLQSHLNLLKQARDEGWESFLVFEDDAIFCEDFTRKAVEFLQAVPDDWHMLYLGGQHLHTATRAPKVVNGNVLRCAEINRTHAMAFHKRFYDDVIEHLEGSDAMKWFEANRRFRHIDFRLGEIHKSNKYNIYAPAKEWIVGQRASKSDVSNKVIGKDMFWNNTIKTGDSVTERLDFAFVMGLHRSGSSLVANILLELGAFMGNSLVGYEGLKGANKSGGEAKSIAKMCEQSYKFPSIRPADTLLADGVTNWVNWAMEAGSEKGHRISAVKYPTLLFEGQVLADQFPEAKFLFCERPLQESIESLTDRSSGKPGAPKATPDECRLLQHALNNAKEMLKSKLPDERYLDVNYDELLNNPPAVIVRICNFLGLVGDNAPTEEQILNAVRLVHPEYRTFVEVQNPSPEAEETSTTVS